MKRKRNKQPQDKEQPGRLLYRQEATIMKWPDVAKIVFSEIQEIMPYWQTKTVEEFIREWPLPLDLQQWIEIRKIEP